MCGFVSGLCAEVETSCVHVEFAAVLSSAAPRQ